MVSGSEALAKLFRSKLRSNPRLKEGKALGWVSPSLAMHMPEAAFKVCFHDRISARCCVWSGLPCRHRTLKPQFGNRCGPSRLGYLLTTVVAELDVFELDSIVIPMESDLSLVRAALPKGYINQGIVAAEFTVVEEAVVDNCMLKPADALRLITAEDLRANMHGAIIAERYPLRCADIHRVGRWSGQQFETLLLLEKYQWPVWIPSNALTVDEPIRLIYRRRHHRKKFITPTSKRCQEVVVLHFIQTVINLRVLKFSLMEAELYNSL